ncbi:MAG TPA: hypothetical protein VMY42_08845 [Thermoguttaceae bacterium]|nr:hypothetical protein [Thermoguttaceae bacterium]
MSQKLVPRKAVRLLLAGILVLPVAIIVIWGVSSLLVAMGDDIGGAVLRYVGLGCGILWTVDLIFLVLAQGLNSLSDSDEGE